MARAQRPLKLTKIHTLLGRQEVEARQRIAGEDCTEMAGGRIQNGIVIGHAGILPPGQNKNARIVRAFLLRQERCLFGSRRCGLAGGQLFLDAGGLAGAVAQVVQLGAAHIAAALDFDCGDQRRVGLEGALDAFAG